MASSPETKISQRVNLYPLSRASSFGAKKNENYASRSGIDDYWQEVDTAAYETVITPFSVIKNAINVIHTNLGRYEKVDQIARTSSVAVVGAFEYLLDVRPLGRRIRELLIEGTKVDVYFGFDGGYLSWSQDTLNGFLEALGIDVTECVDINSSIKRMSLSCTTASYEAHLRRHNLPLPKFGHVIVTTEHSGYRVTGGIGSYVKECDNLYGEDVAIVIVDNNYTLNYEKLSQHQWMAPQLFLGEERVQAILESNYDTIGDIVEETLECIVALYSQVESIESQEMLLCRAIDAKRLHMIPSDVRLMTVCHGSSLHLAKAKRSVLDAENIHVAYREKYTIENSDTVILPTEYLRQSYIDSGISGLEDKSRVIKRLPFDLSRIPEGAKLQGYRRLLYIGKTSTIKGFDLFLETLLELHKKYPEIHEQIEEVTVMATSPDIVESYLKSLYDEASRHYNIAIISLDRETLLATLAEYSDSTLGLITYRGDNHPLTVLELMAVGLDFVAADAAGTPELILPGYESYNLAHDTTEEYAETVFKALGNPEARSRRVLELRKEYRRQQEEINTSYSLDTIRQLPVAPEDKRNSMVNPVINVSIVGDSGSALFKRTSASLDSQTYLNIAGSNKGKEDAGLILRLYAGDILYPEAISDMVSLLNRQGVGAVLTDAITMSYEGDGRSKGYEEFHPYPPQLGSVFLQEKYNRRMVGLFKDNTLEDSFTDWQKSTAVVCKGEQVAVVPRLSMELVERPDFFTNDPVGLSSKWSHAFMALPVFDAAILYSELRRLDDIYWGLKRVGHLESYFVPHNEAVAPISPNIVRIVGAYNRFTPRLVRRGVSMVAEGAFIVLRAIKRVVKN